MSTVILCLNHRTRLQKPIRKGKKSCGVCKSAKYLRKASKRFIESLALESNAYICDMCRDSMTHLKRPKKNHHAETATPQQPRTFMNREPRVEFSSLGRTGKRSAIGDCESYVRSRAGSNDNEGAKEIVAQLVHRFSIQPRTRKQKVFLYIFV